MVSFPPCKINLGLNIIRKRPDGFHDIETCFFPVPWCDILEIIPSSELSFTITGNAIPGDADANLCVKAYHLLKRDFDIPAVHMHLHKIIPTGAGLGGGSSDAAATLNLLNDVFELTIPSDQLRQYAAFLGSDCAFFIQPRPTLGSGRGEVLEDVGISLRGLFLVIVKPDAHISTAAAYAGVSPARHEVSIRKVLAEYPITAWKELLKNDFEYSVFEKYPNIRHTKEKLYNLGATYASMSGSGSAVFGIFTTPPDVKKNFPGEVCWMGKLVM